MLATPPTHAPATASDRSRERNTSPSPSSRQGGFLGSLGARLSRTFSRTEDGNEQAESEVGSTSPFVVYKQDRSLSRGRDALQSTGRGGFGNIRAASQSRDRSAVGGPDDFSTTRGREREVPGSTAPVYSTGRGGAGNLRSPSRGAREEVGADRYEKGVIDSYVSHQTDAPISTGRGGLGNIAARSKSRDPSGVRGTSRDPKARHATGRGGVGNIRDGDGYDANAADEVERAKAGLEREHLPHSTGRGGIANITEQDEPALERPSISHEKGEYRSGGRGGAGNIVRN